MSNTLVMRLGRKLRSILLGASVGVIASNSALADAEIRKQQSIKDLQVRDIATIDHLPTIEDDTMVTLRTKQEIVDRLIATAIVGVYGETRDIELVKDVIAEQGAGGMFSGKEMSLLGDQNPSEQDFVNAIWRYESAWVMLWALGFIDELGPENTIADVPKLAGMVRELGRDGFMAGAKPRSKEEILDYADLIYRMNWAVVNARVTDTPAPEGIDPSSFMSDTMH